MTKMHSIRLSRQISFEVNLTDDEVRMNDIDPTDPGEVLRYLEGNEAHVENRSIENAETADADYELAGYRTWERMY